jgi:hypothetical protein
MECQGRRLLGFEPERVRQWLRLAADASVPPLETCLHTNTQRCRSDV